MNLTDKHTTVFIIRTAAVIIKPVLCSFQGSYSQYAFNTLILFDFSVYSCRRVMIYNATIQCHPKQEESAQYFFLMPSQGGFPCHCDIWFA